MARFYEVTGSFTGREDSVRERIREQQNSLVNQFRERIKRGVATEDRRYLELNMQHSLAEPLIESLMQK